MQEFAFDDQVPRAKGARLDMDQLEQEALRGISTNKNQFALAVSSILWKYWMASRKHLANCNSFSFALDQSRISKKDMLYAVVVAAPDGDVAEKDLKACWCPPLVGAYSFISVLQIYIRFI